MWLKCSKRKYRIWVNVTDRASSGLYRSFGGVPGKEFQKFPTKPWAVMGYFEAERGLVLNCEFLQTLTNNNSPVTPWH
jgi:hypothetical protein